MKYLIWTLIVAGTIAFSLAFIQGAYSEEQENAPSHISVGCLHPKDLTEMLKIAHAAKHKKHRHSQEKAWKEKLDSVCSLIDLNALEYVRTLSEIKVDEKTYYINEFYLEGFPKAKVYAYTTALPSWLFDL